jgi:thioredoxin-like negative regulator of GroEL
MPRVLVKNFLDNNSGTSNLQISLLKELENRFRGRVEFEYLNAKENESQVTKYKIKELPTIIIECNGREMERFVGLTQQRFLKKAIEKVLSECR